LTRSARPAGQPAAVTPLRYVGLRKRESNQRESAPGIRVSLRETSLFSALFRGSSRWAIHGPSLLIWHPCQIPLYTAPPLGLLTGPGTAAPARSVGAVLTAKLLTASAHCCVKRNHRRRHGYALTHVSPYAAPGNDWAPCPPPGGTGGKSNTCPHNPVAAPPDRRSPRLRRAAGRHGPFSAG